MRLALDPGRPAGHRGRSRARARAWRRATVRSRRPPADYFARTMRRSSWTQVRRGDRFGRGAPDLVSNAGTASATFLVLDGIGDWDFVLLTLTSPLTHRAEVNREVTVTRPDPNDGSCGASGVPGPAP